MTIKNGGYVIAGMLVAGPIGCALGRKGFNLEPAFWTLVWGVILVCLGIWLGSNNEEDEEGDVSRVVCRICKHQFITSQRPYDVKCPNCENNSGDLDDGSDDIITA